MTDPIASKRVALATEVLRRLSTRELKPSNGGYFQPTATDGVCRACAAASLAVACCGLDDLREKSGGTSECGHLGIRACLADVFDGRQLALIEAAYELSNGTPLADEEELGPDDTDEAARMFAADPEDDDLFNYQPHELFGRTARMRAIMRNIVTNGGTFVPGVVP